MKKIIIVSAAAAVAMFGAVGVAYAGDEDQGGDSNHHSRSSHSRYNEGDNNTNCTSDDTVNQHNRGRQVVGGNLTAQDVAGNVLGVQSTRPAAICPSIGNNNHL